MATIEKYTARQGLNPGGAPQISLDKSLSSAVQGLGSAVNAYADQAQQREDQRNEFKAANGKRRLDLELEQERQSMLENAAPDGAGFHDSFMRGVFQPKREEFLSSLPEKLREKYSVMLGDDDGTGNEGADRAAWSIRAAETERDTSYNWYRSELGTSQEQLATAISMDPDGYDDFLKTGIAEIDSSGLPNAEKMKLRKDWENMAQVAHLNRMLEQDPEAVIKELGADPRFLSPTTQYEMLKKSLVTQESGGDANAISPKGAIGIMQVMPGTAIDIAKDLKDKNFNPKWNAQEITQYLSNPTINQRYGDYYLRKQIKAYGGDLEAALIAYNGGPGRANEWLKANRDDSVLPAETRKYYKAILGRLPGNIDRPKGDPNTVKFAFKGRADLPGSKPGEEGLQPELVNRTKTAFAALGIDNVKINSGHRGEADNERVGGAKKSQHLHGAAIDIDVSGYSIPKRVEIIRALSANGITGIGVGANIIHADIGGRRSWGYPNIPKWAQGAIEEHNQGTSKAPNISGRYASLPYDKRQTFIHSADQAVTTRYNQQTKATAVQKVQLQQQMANELASLAATGKTTGFDETQVATVLGEDDYLKYTEKKQLQQRMFTAKQDIPTMSSDEMAARIDDYDTRPGAATFAADQEVKDAVVKEVDRVTKLRANSPDKAALMYPEVNEAYQTVQTGISTNNLSPDDVQRFVKLMMEKQAEFNIKPEARAPIPKTWAMEIGRSFSRTPELGGRNAADVRASVAAQYQSLQSIFGEYTEEVIIHALSEYKGIGKNTGELITGYMQAIEAGGDPLRLNKNAATDRDQIEENNGPSWFSRTKDYLFGFDDEDEEAVPEVLDEAPISNETLLRIIETLAVIDTPEEEAALIERYGEKAVEAAKASRLGGS